MGCWLVLPPLVQTMPSAGAPHEHSDACMRAHYTQLVRGSPCPSAFNVPVAQQHGNRSLMPLTAPQRRSATAKDGPHKGRTDDPYRGREAAARQGYEESTRAVTLATLSEPHILCGSTAAPFCVQLHWLNHKPAKGADGQQLCAKQAWCLPTFRGFVPSVPPLRRPHGPLDHADRARRGRHALANGTIVAPNENPLASASGSSSRKAPCSPRKTSSVSDWALMILCWLPIGLLCQQQRRTFIINQPSLGEWSEQAG